MLPHGRTIALLAVSLPYVLAGALLATWPEGEASGAGTPAAGQAAPLAAVSVAAAKPLLPREAFVPARPDGQPAPQPAPTAKPAPAPAPKPAAAWGTTLSTLARTTAEPGQAAVSTAKIAVGTSDPAAPASAAPAERVVIERSPQTGDALLALTLGMVLLLVTGLTLRRSIRGAAAAG